MIKREVADLQVKIKELEKKYEDMRITANNYKEFYEARCNADKESKKVVVLLADVMEADFVGCDAYDWCCKNNAFHVKIPKGTIAILHAPVKGNPFIGGRTLSGVAFSDTPSNLPVKVLYDESSKYEECGF